MSASRTQREVAETLRRLREEIAAEQGTPDSGANRDRTGAAPEAVPSGEMTDPKKKRRRAKSRETEAQATGGRVLITPPPTSGNRNLTDKDGQETSSNRPSSDRAEAEAPPSPKTGPEGRVSGDHPSPPANGSASEAGALDQTVAERPSSAHSPRRVDLSRHRFQVMDQDRTDAVLAELLTHQKRGRGKVIGIAGLPRHGKTTLADRLRERAAARPGADLRYNKTERGQVNIYYLPGSRNHHALIDTAGEDYRVLGDYSRELPELMSRFLWPVLQRLDGLMLLMALPIVWAGWNQESEERRVPSPREREEMAEAQAKMLAAHRMLVKYAVVARNLRRISRQLPELKLNSESAPSRDQIDDAFMRAPLYDRPISVVLSKADLYVGKERPCLFSPPLPRLGHKTPQGIRPDLSDPLLVAAGHFPDFLDFLCENVKSFKWTFAQALEDRSDAPSPMEARQGETDVSSLVGAEGAVDFLTRHPWRIPGPSTARLLRWDRRLRPGAWDSVGAGGGRV